MTLSTVNNIVPRFMCEEIEVQKGQESTLTKAAQQEDAEPVFKPRCLWILPEAGVGAAGREGQGVGKMESRESRERRQIRPGQRGRNETLKC